MMNFIIKYDKRGPKIIRVDVVYEDLDLRRFLASRRAVDDEYLPYFHTYSFPCNVVGTS